MTCLILRELRWLLPASSRVNWRRGNSGQKGTGRDTVLILHSLFPFFSPLLTVFLSSVFIPFFPRALFGDSDEYLSLPGAVLRKVHGDLGGNMADEGAFWKDFVEEVT